MASSLAGAVVQVASKQVRRIREHGAARRLFRLRDAEKAETLMKIFDGYKIHFFDIDGQ
jgi:hypothetical protein